MTIQQAQDEAAKEFNGEFDYRALRNGVQVGNIKMLYLDRANIRAIEIFSDKHLAEYKEKLCAVIYEAMHDGILKYGVRVKPSAKDLKEIINNLKP